jgi:hypothetical protein
MIYGLLIDFVGINLMHFWEYPDRSKLVYFAITLPCWGIFSMAVNLIWNWIKPPWLASVVVTTGLFLLLEIPNLLTRSWVYYVPMWFVIIGWVPLILSFRIIYLVIADRFHFQKELGDCWRDIENFAGLLEAAGYETEYGGGALELIKKELIPLAREKKISLLEAAWKYADQDGEQDTSWFQLFHALNSCPPNILKSLDIHQPL